MFRTNQPVTGPAFFNRARELADLEQLVSQLESDEPRWVAIIGRRKVGKTSLVLELARRRRARGLAFVILDTQECAPLSLEFFRLYALRIADAFLGAAVGYSLELLAENPDEYRN